MNYVQHELISVYFVLQVVTLAHAKRNNGQHGFRSIFFPVCFPVSENLSHVISGRQACFSCILSVRHKH